MGVIKNDVGRPSNKTIMIRRILKLILILIIVGLAVALGYFIKDKEDGKPSKKNNVEENKKESVDVYKKYKGLDFVRTTEIGNENSPYIIGSESNSWDANLKVENGTMLVNLYDYSGKNVLRQDITEIDSKVKYITMFGVCFFDAPVAPVAALTEDNKLYIGLASYEKKVTYDFSLFKENIIDMLVVNDDDPEKSTLYVLTSEGDLKRVEYSEKNDSYQLTNDLYEERYIYLGNYHEGGISYTTAISAKDNKLFFTNNVKAKLNGNDLIIKNAVITEDGENSELYVITDDNKIVTTKKKRYYGATLENCKDCYEFKMHNSLKVKNVKYETYKDSDEIEHQQAKITYEDNSTEIIKDAYYHYDK